MFSSFFIKRPILSAVISIVLVILGMLAFFKLPISQYPDILPPSVVISANYPGANSLDVARDVARPIEEEVNGVENMLYLSSVCSNNGEYRLTITFKVGTDLDQAMVQVQNRLSKAEPFLPQEVRKLGLELRKQTTNVY
ncbi:MAG: hydrophobic/amphiphilic exporter (mainly bacteria), family [Desulfonauticus sp.]|jgi:multidrug efflux pump subunit AcrB|nr:hydrophobic/amphiphilic exporter (mainly bacteria), family [Desulfonauticus sp.]